MFGLNLKDRLRTFNRQRVYKRGLNKPCVGHPDGFLFSGRNQIMAKGGYEPFEADLVRKILPDVQVFVNIGAHHGYYSCLALSSNTDTIAYEPEASNILMLEKHIKANDFSNQFTLHPCAVGSQSGELVLYGGGSGGSLLPKSNLAPLSEQQTVSVVTLDDTLSLNNKKALCLMDVEGFEHEALKGARKILSSKIKPYWIIEVLPYSPQGDVNHEFERVFELMQSHGYTAWGIDEGANQLVPFTSEKALKVKEGELKTNMSNFLFTERDDDLAQRLLWIVSVVVRLRREYRNPAWPYDFVHFPTDDGVIIRALNIPDELRLDCFAIKLDQKLNSTQVTDGLFNGVIF